MPRPSKLTPEIQGRILGAVGVGATYDDAAYIAGISPRTLYRWLERGERGQSPYAEFCQAVKNSERLAKVIQIQRLHHAGEHDWRAAATWLERRYPEEWGRRERHKVSGSSGGAIIIRFEGDSHSDNAQTG